MMRSQKMSFIIVWKVAGLLVSLKNMTSSSKSPQLVQKTTFHSSPSEMCTLLYPHWTSNLVKYLVSQSWFMSSEMRGIGYWFLMVMAVRGW